ncbi:MAG: flagellar assembly protein FliX [Pseudomonadota bacterium]
MYIEAKTIEVKTRRAGPSPARTASGAPQFAALLSERRPVRSGALRGASPVEGLLSLQAGEEAIEPATRERARKGLDMLETLDALRADMLSGQAGTKTLDTLAGQLQGLGGRSQDAGLERVMKALELRVRVELAKAAC